MSKPKSFTLGYIQTLRRLATPRRSITFRLVSLATGGIFFLVILPALFLWIGGRFELIRSMAVSRPLEISLSILSLSTGLGIIAWTAQAQWHIGHGTPAPNAPTRRLVIMGPYQHCRNPIQLGAMLYYLGIGTGLRSLGSGLFALGAGWLLGTLYHRFVEEKELELRFGGDYRAYKKSTPFLIPKFRK